MLLGICRRAEPLTRNPHAAKPVSAAEVAERERAAAAEVARERAVVVVVAVAVAVAAADGDRISRSSTISFFSVISVTVSASIASAITAPIKPTSALWRKMCS